MKKFIVAFILLVTNLSVAATTLVTPILVNPTILGPASFSSGVVLPNGTTATTQPTYDASNNIATASMVQGAIQRTMATVALNLGSSASGVYSFASTGTGFTASFTTSGGAITGITGIYNGGSGYKVGDVLTAGTGTTNAGNQDSFIMINAVSGTAATGATVLYGGSGYTAGTNVAHSTSASFPYTFTVTGTLTGTTTFLMTPGTLLTQSNQWYVNNNTTGAYSLYFKMSGQSGGISTDTATGTGVLVYSGTNNAAAISSDGVNDVYCVAGACATGPASVTQLTLPIATGASGVTQTSDTITSYEEGTWTPAFTNLTVVNGTGGVTYSGNYTKIGRLVCITAQITVTGTATSSSVNSSTFINNLPFAVSANAVGVVDSSALVSYGTAVFSGSSSNMYTPTWTTANANIIISGCYW